MFKHSYGRPFVGVIPSREQEEASSNRFQWEENHSSYRLNAMLCLLFNASRRIQTSRRFGIRSVRDISMRAVMITGCHSYLISSLPGALFPSITVLPSTRSVTHKGKEPSMTLASFVAPNASVIGDVKVCCSVASCHGFIPLRRRAVPESFQLRRIAVAVALLPHQEPAAIGGEDLDSECFFGRYLDDPIAHCVSGAVLKQLWASRFLPPLFHDQLNAYSTLRCIPLWSTSSRNANFSA